MLMEKQHADGKTAWNTASSFLLIVQKDIDFVSVDRYTNEATWILISVTAALFRWSQEPVGS